MSDSATKPTVLVLDDEKNIRRSVEIVLTQEGMHVLVAHDPAAAMRMLRERIIDVLLLDIRLGVLDGITFFQTIQREGYALPTIFISGHATLTQAAQAVKLGGYDFIEKPFTAEKLVIAVQRCLELTRLKNRLHVAEAQLKVTEIIGGSPPIRQLLSDALRVADSDAAVLIQGESGSGKELLASTIHANSLRRDAPLIKVNCSAIPENLIESELFGHERHAFTSTAGGPKGGFELAHHGTIFLDEVADLSPAAQARILRVLQSGELQTGVGKSIRIDVRVISASHKDLKQLTAEGSFRADLYYRLNVVPLHMPSLRERPQDIPLLVRFLTQRLCARNNLKSKPIDADVIAALQRYHWPGNVRELANVLERMLLLSAERVTMANLPDEIVEAEDPASDSKGPALKSLRDKFERDCIIDTLRRHGGNVSQSAQELGVRRTYLHRRITVLNIAKRDFFG